MFRNQMSLIGKYDQVIKTPEMIKENEFIDRIFEEGRFQGIFWGMIISNVAWLISYFIINLIIK